MSLAPMLALEYLDAREVCDICGPQPPPIVHVICHPDPPRRVLGCGHALDDHNDSLGCRVCGTECGLECRPRQDANAA